MTNNNDSRDNMVLPHKLSEKELKDQELIATHLVVLKDYMITNLEWTAKQRRNVLKLYEEEIDRSNIRWYYNRHSGLFLKALIQGKLESIAQYSPPIEDDEDWEDDED